MVAVENLNGKLRICLNPHLNKAIKRHHHHLLTTDEILSRFSKRKIFVHLDASCGYWQISVNL